MWPELPQDQSPWIDVSKLSQIFDSTTNSYKFFFFLSLIDLASTIQQPTAPAPTELSPSPNDSTQEPLAIPLYKVLWHMLELSFGPVNYFHVRLPFQDRLPLLVKEVNTQLSLGSSPLTQINRDKGLTLLGQTILQDLCAKTRSGWPILRAEQEIIQTNEIHSIIVRSNNTKKVIKLSLGGESEYSVYLADRAGGEHELGSSDHNNLVALTKPILRKEEEECTANMSYKDFLRELASLETYVPFRLLKPWVGGHDVSAKFSNIEQVLNLSDPTLDHSLPYYLGKIPSAKLDSTHLTGLKLGPELLVKVVVINPLWLNYLQKHGEILKSFAYQKLALKLENLNPLMPALLAKLMPQYQRSTLNTQTKYFNAYIQASQGNRGLEPLYDIYTQQLVPLNDYALDHFLPWSFVHHNLIWNLTPIEPLLNSSKSNQLPSEQYIEALAKQHQMLLRYHVQQAQDDLDSKCAKGRKHGDVEDGNYLGQFNVFVDDFLQIGQGYSVTELSQCSSQTFYNLFADQIKPALQVAANQGFSPWVN